MYSLFRYFLFLYFIFVAPLAAAKSLVLVDLQYLDEVDVSGYPFYRMISEGLAEQDYKLQLKVMPGKRAHVAVMEGRADGLLARFNGGYDGFVKIPEATMNMAFHVYADKSTGAVASPCGKKLVMVLGHEFLKAQLESFYNCQFSDHDIIYVYRVKQMALLLYSRRVDFVAMPYFFKTYFTQQYPGESIESPKPFFRGDLFVYLSERHRPLVDKLNDYFKRTKALKQYPFTIEGQVLKVSQ